MSRTLLITIRFHEGRYHGMGDVPPSPARLFQALVAGVGLSGPLASQEFEALEWLEKLDPPVIGSPRMLDGQSVKNYVPNNDLDAVGGDERRIGEIRTSKLIKPRLFDPNIPFIYAWMFDDEGESEAQSICTLAERLYQFGRGVDLAWAVGEVLNCEEGESRLVTYPGLVYRPSDGGTGRMLSCPQPGSLKSLKDRYAANPQRFKSQGRGKAVKQLFNQPPKPRFVQMAYDSPPLRRVYELRHGTSEAPFAVWPLTRISQLVVELRNRAVERLRVTLPGQSSEIERFLVGRKADGTDDGPTSLRIKIVPLPSIGHYYADRGIRRVLVEVPAGCPLRADDVYWAFSGIELATPEIGAAQPVIITPSTDEGMFLHYGIGNRAHHVWRTVTPVVLPESASRRRIDPKRIIAEAKDGSERAAEQARAVGAVIQALRFAEIRAQAKSIRVQREPFEANGERVEAFASGTRFAKERLWHVEINFSESNKGPLVIGDGRFLGLGVMAPVKRLPQHDARRFSIVRFAFDGSVLPLVTETLLLAEQARRSLLGMCKHLARRWDSSLTDPDIWRLVPAFWGKNEQAQPRIGHQHAFFLPADEDGDGRLDHLTIFAPMGFNTLERQTLDKLRRLPLGDGDPLQLLLVGLGNPQDFRAPLLNEATVWISATPFLVTRFPKTRGTKRDRPEDYASPQAFVRHILQQELQRRSDLPPVASIDEEEFLGVQRLRSIQFQRFRKKPGDDGGRRRAGVFRITFTAPVRGPLCLGHSCHFGLGLFVPSSSGSPRAESC